MKRQIIKIDEEKCNGCGICVEACHEGAIGMVNGKAKLLRNDYCDGLGDCLPTCPTGAISFEQREALSYDEEAVQKNMRNNKQNSSCSSSENEHGEPLPCGCPGSNSKTISRKADFVASSFKKENVSRLSQWPVQIKLAPINASYFDNAKLLIAADCSAYAYGDFHERFIKNHVTLIGCPKLDEGDYSQKLTMILSENNIKSVTVVRMEVPCCGGIEHATIRALQDCGKMIPWEVITLSTDGKILE